MVLKILGGDKFAREVNVSLAQENKSHKIITSWTPPKDEIGNAFYEVSLHDNNTRKAVQSVTVYTNTHTFNELKSNTSYYCEVKISGCRSTSPPICTEHSQ